MAQAGRPGIQRHRLIIPALLLVVLLSALDQTIVVTALPIIARDLGRPDRLPWIVTAYVLTATIALPVHGRLGDQIGRRRVLLGAIAIFLTGSALCGTSGSVGQLILWRALQGLGAAGLAVTAMAVVADIAPPRDRGRIQGWFGAVVALATVAGPLIGGLLVEHASWHWIFYVNLPIGLVAASVVGVALPRTPPRKAGTTDVAGALLLGAALGALVLASALGGSTPWKSRLVVGLFATAIMAGAALVPVERRARRPILPTALLRRRDGMALVLVSLASGVPFLGISTFVPLFLQAVRGFKPSTAGLGMAPFFGGLLLSSVVSGHLISRLGRHRIFPITGSVLSLAGLAVLALAGSAAAWILAVGMSVAGLGLGMTAQPTVLMAQASVAHRDVGAATAGITMFRALGGLLGLTLLGSLFGSVVRSQGTASALHVVFSVIALVGVLQLVASGMLSEPAMSE